MIMNREQLKELGLTDEQVENVMKEYGKSVNDIKAKADKVDSLESQIQDYQKQIEERDNQLEELKKIDAEGLQAKIEELQQLNEQTVSEFEEKLQKQAFEHRLENSLKDAGVRNVKAVKALLDTENIKLDGETLLGLDDQLQGLQESDPYLFAQNEEQEEQKPNFSQGNHSKGSGESGFGDILLGKN